MPSCRWRAACGQRRVGAGNLRLGRKHCADAADLWHPAQRPQNGAPGEDASRLLMGDYTSIKASNHVALPPSLSWKPNLAISLPAGAVCAHHQRSWCREQRAPGKGEKGGSASWAHAVRHFLLPTASTLDVCSPHCSCSHHPPLSCASLWFVSPVQILALVMVSLLHLVYLRLCLPFRMRIELAAGGCRFLLEHVCHCCSSACTLCLSQASLFWSFQCKDEAHASSTPSRFQAPRTLLGRSPPLITP